MILALIIFAIGFSFSGYAIGRLHEDFKNNPLTSNRKIS